MAKEVTESHKALQVLAGAGALELMCVLVFAGQARSAPAFFSAASVGLLVAAGAALVGGTLGFLFGIPRTLQQGGDSSDGAPPSGASSARVDYRVNTNLEQISDWLTKILVGVGLTQIGEIRHAMGAATRFASRGLGSTQASEVFAFAVISYSLVLGFLFGYLWTRLFLASALRQADQVTLGALTVEVQKVTELAQDTERKLDELREQAALDATALNLAHRQLNPSSDTPPVAQSELEKAIGDASTAVRVQIFNQAVLQRTDNWRDPKMKPRMELTIPIFRSLVLAAPDFHRHHAQLAYALKDKLQPDWAEAERELDIAIDLRGPARENGWHFYEFNRAMCKIALDPDFRNGTASAAPSREQILADIVSASETTTTRRLLLQEEPVEKWIALNGVSESEIRGRLTQQ